MKGVGDYRPRLGSYILRNHLLLVASLEPQNAGCDADPEHQVSPKAELPVTVGHFVRGMN